MRPDVTSSSACARRSPRVPARAALLGACVLLASSCACPALARDALLMGTKADFATGLDPRSVAIGDLNRDGLPDLVVACRQSNGISVLLNTGTGGFAPRVGYGAGTAPVAVLIGGLIGSTDADVAIANEGANTLTLQFGDGNGHFSQSSDVNTGAGPCAMAAGYLTGDGTLDLAVADRVAGTVSVLYGEEALGARSDFPAGTGPCAVAIADVNDDLVPDLLVANEGSGTVSVLLGDGAGYFAPYAEVPVGGRPSALALADCDGDSRLDLVVTDRDADSVRVLRGHPTFEFTPWCALPTGRRPVAVAVTDMDWDDVPDIVVANDSSSTFTVLLGDGAGGFGARADFVTGSHPCALAVADVNGDGNLDVVTANRWANTVSVRYGIPRTRTTLASSADPSAAGATLTLTAHVELAPGTPGTPGGTVEFFADSALLGTALLSGGAATRQVSGLALGTHVLTAHYLGNASTQPSTSPPLLQRVVLPGPRIRSVRDVPADQGRLVRLVVEPSGMDCDGSTTPIVRYEVFRRIDGSVPAAPARAAEPGRALVAGWDAVGTMGAYGDSVYNIVVPTLVDSNDTGTHQATFFVRAATSVPTVHYDSAPDSGHSVDNLRPAMPADFAAAYAGGATHLHWSRSSEADFWYYRLYRGAAADFVPGPDNLIAVRADTGYVDAGPVGSWYKLTAVDVNGNEGDCAAVTLAGTLAVSGEDEAFRLEGARPNPSTGRALTVTFVLPDAAPARLDLLTVTGRRVAGLEVGGLGPGRHVLALPRTVRLEPGIYLFRLARDGQVRVARVAVIE